MAPRQPELLIVDDATPSRPLRVGGIMVGDAVEQHFAFDAAARDAFAKVANDRAPVHEDERFAHAHGFRGTVIQGLCVSTRFSRLIGMYLPGEYAILETLALKFRHPTYEGQALVFRAEVTRILPPLKVVKITLSASSEGIHHITGEAQCLIR
jgi:acyl dehydratase